MATKKTTTGTTTRSRSTAAKKQEAPVQAAGVDTAVIAEKDAEIEKLKAMLSAMQTEKETAEQNTQSDMERMREQIAAMQNQLAAAQKPQIVTVSADTERVQFLWQSEVADDNVTSFGDGGMYGRIVGKTGMFSVPKSDLSRILTAMNRYFLDQRELIVVSGLNEEEREALGVNYHEGELLDRKAFAKMVELEDGILEIYPQLCPGHKEMVSKRYNEAYEMGNPHVRRDVVVELNRMSKAAGSKDGDFKAIIDKMNAADAE